MEKSFELRWQVMDEVNEVRIVSAVNCTRGHFDRVVKIQVHKRP